MSITDVDLERSLVNHIAANLPADLHLFRPGVTVTKPTPLEWVAPRIVSIDRESSRSGQGQLGLEVLCVLVTLRLSNKPLDLSTLIDKVRPVVDASMDAPAAEITNESAERLGHVTFGPASEERERGVSFENGEREEFKNVDLCRIFVECQIAPCA